MDKNTILQQTNQIEIYNFYYGSHFQPYTKISSPFSEDQNPSFKVFKNGTFKCFSTGKQGDVWQFVADIKGLDCKTQFAEVLKTISNDMGVILQQQQKNSSHQSISKNTDNHHFKYYDKPYTSQSLEFWTQGNWKVTKAILEKYNVKNLDKYEYFNSKKNTIQKIKLYSGIVGFIYKVNSNAEIYIPAQGKNKKIFYNNLQFSDIFGYEQLKEKEDYIIITAGKKDCLILNANGFPAVSFRSESGFIKEEEILKLKQKTDNIYICYDNDKTGLETALKLCNSYSIKQIILPEKYNDIADYFLVYDKSHYQKLIDEIRELEEAETKKTLKTLYFISQKNIYPLTTNSDTIPSP
ncbi:toprim domain-containing protein [Riemerella anatipestifer]|nr:toprim domain-containing protein [Riemerella anatipestifer]